MKMPTIVRIARSKTIHLALSYLSIIMVLSIGFSVVFYTTTSNTLGKQLGPPTSASVNVAPPKGESGLTFNIHANRQLNGPAEVAYLQQLVEQGRSDLRRALVLLNIAALILSIGLSYFLARRTLRPIEAAIEAQSRFASNASHELRTPLAVMQVEIERALTTLTLSKPARKLIESNLEEVTHLKQLSEDLLRLARQTEKPDLQPTWLDDVASVAMNRAAKSAQAKGMIITDISPHVSVIANQQSLLQAILILLDNAIKYSKPGSTIYIEGLTERKYACINIRDEGPGIASVDLNHIFDRFYRAELVRKQQITGNGLGLSIAQTLMAQQRGSITASSTPGKGSTFTIKLPLNRYESSQSFPR